MLYRIRSGNLMGRVIVTFRTALQVLGHCFKISEKSCHFSDSVARFGTLSQDFGKELSFFGQRCKIWDIISRFRKRVVIFRTALQDLGHYLKISEKNCHFSDNVVKSRKEFIHHGKSYWLRQRYAKQ